jgi:hypothetical protein
MSYFKQLTANNREEGCMIMSNYAARKRRRGASLAEMMIALFVLSIVLLGIMGGVLISAGTVAGKEQLKARDLVSSILVNYESVPFDQIWDTSPPSSNGLYTVQAPVFNPPDYDPDLASVDITIAVTWGGVNGGSKKFELTKEVSASAWQNVGKFPN